MTMPAQVSNAIVRIENEAIAQIEAAQSDDVRFAAWPDYVTNGARFAAEEAVATVAGTTAVSPEPLLRFFELRAGQLADGLFQALGRHWIQFSPAQRELTLETLARSYDDRLAALSLHPLHGGRA
jgi:hypothetical protein